MTAPDVVVLCFGGRRVPRPLADLPVITVDDPTDVDAAAAARRVVVVGARADLGVVLSRLLRKDRLDVEVGFVGGRRSARRARNAPARRVPLIRDETGAVVTGVAHWLPADEGSRTVTGEAVVDDAVLFDGEVPGVRIEPTDAAPGLRATVLTGRLRPRRWITRRWITRRWVTGRAAQLGTTGVLVVRDGVPAPRQARRSTFYRNTTGWLRVG